jgi:LuxR family transcriptional regulator, maltose regulon positive regulatory protein
MDGQKRVDERQPAPLGSGDVVGMPEGFLKQTEAWRTPRFASSKFAAPKGAVRPVHRTRLMDLLDQGERARLTLVVASAGAGKTILLSDWLATSPRRSSAWLSCDSADADPVRFIAGLIDTLRLVAKDAGLGEDSRELLILDGEVSADVIASLADDVGRLGVPVVLIIDDFHLTGPGGVDVLTWLLEYRPDSLQVVLATRVDPSLRLHRMRANRELVELRERDLAFSAEETGLLVSEFGIQLSHEDIAVMQRRSEGWAAGLQMAAISIRHRSGSGGVAGGVELNRHSVTGYFLEEVLYRQPDAVAQFMLSTSILDELSADACAAVYGAGASRLLEQVYRDHLFLTLIDEAAGTYHYHQLIKEVLQAELRARSPEAKRQLHERAANHLADRGRVGAAARHLLEAGNPSTAFRLLSDGVIVDVGSNPALQSALDDIHPDDFSGNPEILVALAAELLLRGDFGRGSRAFELALVTGVDEISQPEAAFRFAVVGSMYHHFRGEEEEALAYRDRAHDLKALAAGSEDWLLSLDSTGAYSHLNLGNFDQALELAEEVVSAWATPPPAFVVSYLGIRSEVAWAQGALSEADAWAGRALATANRTGFERHTSAFLALRTKALLALERREISLAERITEERLHAARPFLDYLAQLDRAHIWAAGGNLDEALVSLPAARTTLRSDHSILLAQADELEARIRLALGDTRGAIGAADRLPEDRRAVMTAMIHLSANEPERAKTALDALPASPPTIRSDLELKLLWAEVALEQESRQAPRLIREALDVIASERFIQMVLDTAPHLVEHLLSDWDRYPRSEHLATLVAAAAEVRQQRLAHRAQSGGLADPLTEAEIKVLRRLPQRLSYNDIATDLHLSLNTVKTHIRHSYMKLDVNSRSDAIKRAASLGLL